MLKIISLWIIQRVFDSIKPKLGAKSQIVYINCLMHHFKDKEATEENSVAFELTKKELNFSSFKHSYEELSQAGLIKLKNETVLFYNLWGKYLDKSQFNVKQEFVLKTITDLESDLHTAQNLKELCMKTYSINMSEYEKLLTFFIDEQKGLQKQYQDLRGCLNHFYNWVSKHHRKQVTKKAIASSKNILGME